MIRSSSTSQQPLPEPPQQARRGESRLGALFHRFSAFTATTVGTPWAFATACASIVLWAALGPQCHFSDTWQLVINTSTTIITFLMVFLIQSTQNRDARAIHLKLDELIRAVRGARNWMVDLEESSDEELARIQREFQRIRAARSSIAAVEAPEDDASDRPGPPGAAGGRRRLTPAEAHRRRGGKKGRCGSARGTAAVAGVGRPI